MSKTILVMGESGSGKTTSLRNLDPATTYIIDADKKGLIWKGWREQYSEEKRNYYKTDYSQMVEKLLRFLNGQTIDEKGKVVEAKNKDGLKYKVVVIDTINALMVADENRRRVEKNYDKWADLAWSIYGILDLALSLRDDLTVVFLAHSQTDRDDTGFNFTRVKTSGKKLDKITVESKLNTVVWARKDEDGYKFVLSDANSTTKVPMGAFEEKTIENDITKVIDALKDF